MKKFDARYIVSSVSNNCVGDDILNRIFSKGELLTSNKIYQKKNHEALA